MNYVNVNRYQSKPQYYPMVFLLIFLAFTILCGWAPKDRGVWFAEVLPSWIIVLFMIVCYLRRMVLSPAAYFFLLIPVLLEAIGGHYTYAEVPCDWLNQLLGSSRNSYDRVAHVAVGCFAWPLLEIIERKQWSASAGFTAVMTVMAFFGIGALYEIFEWRYAIAYEAGASDFLGSQGDIWDAQKDMLCDGVGAAVTVALFYLSRPFTQIQKLKYR